MECKRILVAVDGSENSLRAVDYVGEVVGGLCGDMAGQAGFHIELLHIERFPERDLFADDGSWTECCQRRKNEVRAALDEARRRLLAVGVAEGWLGESYVVSCKSPFADRAAARCSQDASISQEILRTMEEGGYGTVVVGRRGVTKAEEFMFGSVSSSIIHNARGCTVWVVA